MTSCASRHHFRNSGVCVCMHVQKRTKKLHQIIDNVVVACNVHLTAALDFSACVNSLFEVRLLFFRE